MIIVHPGSACGSADMNLGRDNASEQRVWLQLAIDQWDGPVAVIDGELSDELDGFRHEWCELGRAIDRCLDRARQQGLPGIRIMGCDNSSFGPAAAAAQIASTLGLTADCDISLTGAWYHSSDGSGCVGAVKDALEELGLSSTLVDPVDMDADGLDHDEDEGNDQDMDEDPGPSLPAPRAPARGPG